jgi:hypothetical protein
VREGNKSASNLSLADAVPHDIYEMELIGDHRFSAAVPVGADRELKKRILGAIKSYYAGNSVDYTIKRYGSSWRFTDPIPRQRFVAGALRCIDQKVSELLTMIMNGRQRPDSVGLLSAEVALVRLKSSFRSANILLSQAHAFEAAAIVRLVLEQIAWAYAVHTCREKKQILRVSPTKAISQLKRLMPFVGSLYGALNAQTHVDPKIAHKYYTENPDGSVDIRHQLSEESFVVLGYSLGALYLFQRVIFEVLGNYLEIHAERRFLDRFPTLSEKLNDVLKTLKSSHEPLRFLPDVLFELPSGH